MCNCLITKNLLDTGADAKAINHLLHAAAKSNHDSLDKVILLTRYAALDVSQVNAEEQTLVHVAADGKPPNTDILLFALDEGVDPNKQDANGDTALHKVTKNYSERKVPWRKSVQAMEHLLRHRDMQPNIANFRGLTPLEILVKIGYLYIPDSDWLTTLLLQMSAKGSLPVCLLETWLENGAEFTGGSHGKEPTKGGLKSALVAISRRPDGDSLIRSLIQHLKDDKLRDYLKDMLEAAVADGSADTVEVRVTV